MQFSLLLVLSVLGLAACQPAYYYHFPKESELRGIRPDSIRWHYAANSITQVPVADESGKLFWLDVTDKTKLVVKSIYGDEYRFYLRSIVTSGEGEGLLGSNSDWTGYEVREHARRTIVAREIAQITVVSEAPALHPIAPTP